MRKLPISKTEHKVMSTQDPDIEENHCELDEGLLPEVVHAKAHQRDSDPQAHPFH